MCCSAAQMMAKFCQRTITWWIFMDFHQISRTQLHTAIPFQFSPCLAKCQRSSSESPPPKLPKESFVRTKNQHEKNLGIPDHWIRISFSGFSFGLELEIHRELRNSVSLMFLSCFSVYSVPFLWEATPVPASHTSEDLWRYSPAEKWCR